MKKYKCPCCGYYTLRAKNEYEICEVCFWEDDPIQRSDETLSGWANTMSLIQARANYRKYGACEKEMLPNSRKPNPDELSGINE